MTQPINMNCKHCGSLLSAVTFACVRGEHCPGLRGPIQLKWRVWKYLADCHGFARLAARTVNPTPTCIAQADTAEWYAAGRAFIEQRYAAQAREL